MVNNICHQIEDIRMEWIAWIMLIGVASVIILGFICKLPGAYFKKDNND